MPSLKSLLHNTVVYSLSNILNAAIPFLLLPILTRILLPAEYGILSMFNASLGIIGAFTGLSVHGAVNVRYADRGDIDFPRYVGSCLSVLSVSTFFSAIIIYYFKVPLCNFTSIQPFWLLVAVIVSSANFLIQIRLGIWQMASKSVYFGVFQVALSALNIGLSIAFVVFLKLGYEGRLWGQALAVSIFAIFGLFTLVKTGWVNFHPKWIYVREALAFGIPLIPHVIGGILLSMADRFIINQKLGLEAAGIYMVAVQIGLGMGLLSNAFNKAFVPWLYEELKKSELSVHYKIVRGTWIYFGLALVVASIVSLSSYWIIYIFAGHLYVGASTALSWIAFGQAFGGMYFMVTNYIFFKRKTHLLAWVTLLSGTIGIIFVYKLVPIFGISGAGFSFATAMLIRFVLTWRLSHKVYPMPWFNVNSNL